MRYGVGDSGGSYSIAAILILIQKQNKTDKLVVQQQNFQADSSIKFWMIKKLFVKSPVTTATHNGNLPSPIPSFGLPFTGSMPCSDTLVLVT